MLLPTGSVEVVERGRFVCCSDVSRSGKADVYKAIAESVPMAIGTASVVFLIVSSDEAQPPLSTVAVSQ